MTRHPTVNPILRPIAEWTTWLFAKLWFRARLHHAERVPKTGAFVVVANHTSFFDPPLLGAFMPREIHFLARSTLGAKGFKHWFLSGLGTVFVDRDAPSRDSIQECVDRLKAGSPILLFPEGTRTADGAIHEFRRGFELIAKRAGVPVLPVGIRGLDRGLPRGKAFPRFAKVDAYVGEPIADLAAVGGGAGVRRIVAELAGAPLSETTTKSTPGVEPGAAAAPRSAPQDPASMEGSTH